MLKQSLTVTLVAAALAGAIAHSADYVTASGMPLKSGSGECVRTGYWTPSSEACEPIVTQVAMQEEPRMPAARVAYSAATLFAFDSDVLDEEARAELDKLVARFEPDDIDKVYVNAHADRVGPARYNVALSERRLEAVRNYLATKGITLSMLFTEAHGADYPVSHCEDLGPAKKDNAALVACLRTDRRAEVEVVGAPRELARTAKRAE